MLRTRCRRRAKQAMMAWCAQAVKKTGARNVCLAGGVALNSKANGKILISGLVDELFVQPAAADDGVALGAALAPYLDNGGRVPNDAMRHVYLGPAVDDEEIEKALCTYKLRATSMRIPPRPLRRCWRKEKFSDGFRGVWNLVRARWARARFSRIRATQR